MNIEDIKIDMKVYTHNDKSSIYSIKSIDLSNNTVEAVNISGTYQNKFHIEDIKYYDFNAENSILETVQVKIDEATSLFDQAFEKFKEAIDFAESNEHYSFRSSEFIDLSDLENVIQSNGWSTSSLWCS